MLTELTLRMLFGQSAKHFRKRVKKRDTVTIIFLFFQKERSNATTSYLRDYRNGNFAVFSNLVSDT
jgi:hypothetical protein